MKILAAAALAGALIASSAAAEPYLLLVHETAADIALRGDAGPEGAAYWGEWAAYSKTLEEAGAIRGGAPLLPSETIRLGAAEAGALALGGYFLIEAESREAAERLAAAAPSVARGGAATIAPHAASPAMPAE